MPSAFPNRYINKTDPQYQMRFRHVFVLQPPLEGATTHDFGRFAQDLKSGIEAKALLDSDSVPHSSFDAQGLTIQSLKDQIVSIVSRNPIEWIRECAGISIMYHPEKRGKLISTLSKLPESAKAQGKKLLSIPYGDDVFAFMIQLHENWFLPTDGLLIWLDNPLDPAAEHIVPIDRGEVLTFSDIYSTKQKMEYFAMMSLLCDLAVNTNIKLSDLKPRYEPLGKAFPDFELLVRDQEWAVEVTRIERDMVSYLRVSKSIDRDMFDKTAQKQVTEDGIIAALTKALDDKSTRRNKCRRYSRACLLLVDVVDSINTETSSVWDGIDLSAFDAVALIKLDSKVLYIKGIGAFK